MTVMDSTTDVRLLHVKEVARRLDIALPTAYRLIASGELPAVKIGGSYRIHPEVVERVFDEAKETA